MDIIKKHGELKSCPKCGDSFYCNNYNILKCACIEIPLNSIAREIMAEKYDDCLCTNCLNDIAKEAGSILNKQNC